MPKQQPTNEYSNMPTFQKDPFWSVAHTEEYKAFQHAKFEAERAQRTAQLLAMQEQQAIKDAERAAQQAEHNTFLQQVQRRREAQARGEQLPPAQVPDLGMLMTESAAQLREQSYQENLQRQATDPYVWSGEGMPVAPPHVQARKAVYFSDLNAQHLAEQQAVEALRLQRLQEQEAL